MGAEVESTFRDLDSVANASDWQDQVVCEAAVVVAADRGVAAAELPIAVAAPNPVPSAAVVFEVVVGTAVAVVLVAGVRLAAAGTEVAIAVVAVAVADVVAASADLLGSIGQLNDGLVVDAEVAKDLETRAYFCPGQQTRTRTLEYQR